jgi:hypothetical protein
MKRLRELLTIAENQKKQLPPLKVGAKTVNDTLRTKRGGKHYSPKTDFKRSKERAETAKAIAEAEERKYFSYSLWNERKDYGNGDGGETHETGVTAGATREAVEARLRGLYRRANNIVIKEISKEAYDKAQAAD